jgi:hypothetical protein
MSLHMKAPVGAGVLNAVANGMSIKRTGLSAHGFSWGLLRGLTRNSGVRFYNKEASVLMVGLDNAGKTCE